MRSCKVPTTPAHPAKGVLERARARCEPAAGPSARSPTAPRIVTNAIVEGRGAPVGLVTTRGFRDVLEIARQNRTHLYRLDAARQAGAARAAPPAPRGHRAGRRRRHRADAARRSASSARSSTAFGAKGSRAWRSACCTPTPIPRTSRRSGRRSAPHFRHVSVSSEINAEFREYERTCTTVLNAAVMPLATRYLDDLRSALGGGLALHLLHSAGGMMSVEAAKARPLAMADLGPRGGRGRGRARGAHARARRARSPSTWAARPPTCASSPTAWPRRPRSDGSATTRCGCPWWRWSPSARAAARSRASTARAR